MPSRVPSALMGGLAAALLVIIFNYLSSTGGFPPNPVYGCFACLSYLICGLVAVWHYTTEHSLTLTGGQGIVLGLLSGVFAGAIAALVGYVLMALGVLPGPEQMIEEMERSGILDQPGSSITKRMLEMTRGPIGLVVSVVQGSVSGAIMGLISGAIGRAIWKKGEEEAA